MLKLKFLIFLIIIFLIEIFCNEKQCKNKGVIINEIEECICEKNKWIGKECEICEKNNTCTDYLIESYENLSEEKNLIFKCDKKFEIQYKRTFECLINDEGIIDMIGGVMKITCEKKKKKIKEIFKKQEDEMKCELKVYKKINEKNKNTIKCEFEKCLYEKKLNNNKYACEKTNCTLNEEIKKYIDPMEYTMFDGFIKNMVDESFVQCDDEFECFFENKKLEDFHINAKCFTGECQIKNKTEIIEDIKEKEFNFFEWIGKIFKIFF